MTVSGFTQWKIVVKFNRAQKKNEAGDWEKQEYDLGNKRVQDQHKLLIIFFSSIYFNLPNIV